MEFTNDYWFMMLTQQGYIVACVDGRGTGFKGADFKKVTQLELESTKWRIKSMLQK
jgi:dipeptidyl-peptidase-4